MAGPSSLRTLLEFDTDTSGVETARKAVDRFQNALDSTAASSGGLSATQQELQRQLEQTSVDATSASTAFGAYQASVISAAAANESFDENAGDLNDALESLNDSARNNALGQLASGLRDASSEAGSFSEAIENAASKRGRLEELDEMTEDVRQGFEELTRQASDQDFFEGNQLEQFIESVASDEEVELPTTFSDKQLEQLDRAKTALGTLEEEELRIQYEEHNIAEMKQDAERLRTAFKSLFGSDMTADDAVAQLPDSVIDEGSVPDPIDTILDASEDGLDEMDASEVLDEGALADFIETTIDNEDISVTTSLTEGEIAELTTAQDAVEAIDDADIDISYQGKSFSELNEEANTLQTLFDSIFSDEATISSPAEKLPDDIAEMEVLDIAQQRDSELRELFQDIGIDLDVDGFRDQLQNVLYEEHSAPVRALEDPSIPDQVVREMFDVQEPIDVENMPRAVTESFAFPDAEVEEFIESSNIDSVSEFRTTMAQGLYRRENVDSPTTVAEALRATDSGRSIDIDSAVDTDAVSEINREFLDIPLTEISDTLETSETELSGDELVERLNRAGFETTGDILPQDDIRVYTEFFDRIEDADSAEQISSIARELFNTPAFEEGASDFDLPDDESFSQESAVSRALKTPTDLYDNADEIRARLAELNEFQAALESANDNIVDVDADIPPRSLVSNYNDIIRRLDVLDNVREATLVGSEDIAATLGDLDDDTVERLAAVGRGETSLGELTDVDDEMRQRITAVEQFQSTLSSITTRDIADSFGDAFDRGTLENNLGVDDLVEELEWFDESVQEQISRQFGDVENFLDVDSIEDFINNFDAVIDESDRDADLVDTDRIAQAYAELGAATMDTGPGDIVPDAPDAELGGLAGALSQPDGEISDAIGREELIQESDIFNLDVISNILSEYDSIDSLVDVDSAEEFTARFHDIIEQSDKDASLVDADAVTQAYSELSAVVGGDETVDLSSDESRLQLEELVRSLDDDIISALSNRYPDDPSQIVDVDSFESFRNEYTSLLETAGKDTNLNNEELAEEFVRLNRLLGDSDISADDVVPADLEDVVDGGLTQDPIIDSETARRFQADVVEALTDNLGEQFTNDEAADAIIDLQRLMASMPELEDILKEAGSAEEALDMVEEDFGAIRQIDALSDYARDNERVLKDIFDTYLATPENIDVGEASESIMRSKIERILADDAEVDDNLVGIQAPMLSDMIAEIDPRFAPGDSDRDSSAGATITDAALRMRAIQEMLDAESDMGMEAASGLLEELEAGRIDFAQTIFDTKGGRESLTTQLQKNLPDDLVDKGLAEALALELQGSDSTLADLVGPNSRQELSRPFLNAIERVDIENESRAIDRAIGPVEEAVYDLQFRAASDSNTLGGVGLGTELTDEMQLRDLFPGTMEFEDPEEYVNEVRSALDEIEDTQDNAQITSGLNISNVPGLRTLLGGEDDVSDGSRGLGGTLLDRLGNRVKIFGDEASSTGESTRKLTRRIADANATYESLVPLLQTTSLSLGAINVKFQSLGITALKLAATIGPLLTAIGGLITGFGTLTAAVGSFTALGAIEYLDKMEQSMAGVNSRQEALSTLGDQLGTMSMQALEPLRTAELADGRGGADLFEDMLQGGLLLLNRFARAMERIIEMPIVAEELARLSDIIFRGQNDDTFVSALESAVKQLLPLFVDMVDAVVSSSAGFVRVTSKIASSLGGEFLKAVENSGTALSLVVHYGAGFIHFGLIAIRIITQMISAFTTLLDTLMPFLSVLPLVGDDTAALMYQIGGLIGVINVATRVAAFLTGTMDKLREAHNMLTTANKKLTISQQNLNASLASTARVAGVLLASLFMIVGGIALVVSGIQRIDDDPLYGLISVFVGVTSAVYGAVKAYQALAAAQAAATGTTTSLTMAQLRQKAVSLGLTRRNILAAGGLGLAAYTAQSAVDGGGNTPGMTAATIALTGASVAEILPASYRKRLSGLATSAGQAALALGKRLVVATGRAAVSLARLAVTTARAAGQAALALGKRLVVATGRAAVSLARLAVTTARAAGQAALALGKRLVVAAGRAAAALARLAVTAATKLAQALITQAATIYTNILATRINTAVTAANTAAKSANSAATAASSTALLALKGAILGGGVLGAIVVLGKALLIVVGVLALIIGVGYALVKAFELAVTGITMLADAAKKFANWVDNKVGGVVDVVKDTAKAATSPLRSNNDNDTETTPTNSTTTSTNNTTTANSRTGPQDVKVLDYGRKARRSTGTPDAAPPSQSSSRSGGGGKKPDVKIVNNGYIGQREFKRMVRDEFDDKIEDMITRR